jgi:hypothetical protein
MSDPYGPPFDPNRGYGQSGYPGQGGGYPDQGGYSDPGYGYQQGGYQQGGYPAPQSPAGYPAPQSPASPWGQQPPPDQGYGQQPQNYGTPYQQGYADPYGAPPPVKKRSRAPLIIGIIVLVLLVVCGGVGALLLVANKSKTNNATPGTGGTTTSTTGTAPTSAAPPPAAKISFTAPDRIGVLHKSSDQSRATSLKDSMSSAGIADPFAVMYDDTTAKGRLAIAWGGTGSAFGGDAQTQLDGFFSSAGANVGGGTVGTREDADPGAVGGSAQCAPVTGTGVTMSMCAWAGDNALLGFIISGLQPSQAKTRMKEMLQAIVVKG